VRDLKSIAFCRFEIRQQEHEVRGPIAVLGRVVALGDLVDVAGKLLVRAVVVVQRDPQLLEVVDAGAAAGRLARGLHRGEQQGDQNANDRNHDQQFDKGETL
jgi:hypothetical protein